MRPSAARCCVPAASRPHRGSASPLPFRALSPGELALGRHWEGEERVKVLCNLPTEAVSLGRQGLLLYNPHAGWREMVDPSPSPRAEVVFIAVGKSIFSVAVVISTCRSTLCGSCQCFGLCRVGTVFQHLSASWHACGPIQSLLGMRLHGWVQIEGPGFAQAPRRLALHPGRRDVKRVQELPGSGRPDTQNQGALAPAWHFRASSLTRLAHLSSFVFDLEL